MTEERSEEQSEDKRYYTPGEVRKRKGCVGCGGMALSLVAGLPLLLLAITFLS
jgi:hypothetical protein